MLDFVRLCRLFPTRLTHLVLRSAQRHGAQRPQICGRGDSCCPSRHSLMLAAATAGPAARPAARRTLAVAGAVSCCAEHHCPANTESAADACHPPATTTALCVSSGLLGLNVACSSCCHSVLYSSAASHLSMFYNIIYSMLYSSHKGSYSMLRSSAIEHLTGVL